MSTSIEARYPNFLIRCAHGGMGRGSIEAKYRWTGSEWAPVFVRGKLNVRVTALRGNKIDDWMSVVGGHEELQGLPVHLVRPEGSAPLRSKHEIICGKALCDNRVPVPESTLQFIFAVTTFAVERAKKPGLLPVIYDLASFVSADAQQDNITFSFNGLRAALAYNNRRFMRGVEH